MDLGETVSQILRVIGDFLNTILGGVINLFNSIFNFLPPHLRTGVGVVVVIIIGVIIFFLWPRD